MTGNCSEPDLEGSPKGQLTMDLQEKVSIIYGIISNDLERLDLRESLEKSFKQRKHSASLLTARQRARYCSAACHSSLEMISLAGSTSLIPRTVTRLSNRHNNRQQLVDLSDRVH